MGTFLYYLPGAVVASEGAVRQAGLEYALGDRHFDEVQTHRGPDGGAGVLATPRPGNGGSDTLLKYDPSNQKWIDCGGYWVGRDRREYKPVPGDLARPTLHPGFTLQLSDKNEWLCPVARALPSFWGFDDEGARARIVAPEFQELSRDGATAFEYFDKEAWLTEGSAPWFDPEWIESLEATEICIRALAANYRIGPREAALLSIPTIGDATVILAALLDLPHFVGDSQVEEKKTV